MSASIRAANVKLKRAYAPPDAKDGVRVLIDRLWPRGVSKERAALDHWMKEIAPSTSLRKWFSHDPERWEKFISRYHQELYGNSDLLRQLRSLARKGPETLVYSAHDEAHNDAVVLRRVLLSRKTPKKSGQFATNCDVLPQPPTARGLWSGDVAAGLFGLSKGYNVVDWPNAFVWG